MILLSSSIAFLISALPVGDANIESIPKPFVLNPAIMKYVDDLFSNVRPLTGKGQVRERLDEIIDLAGGEKPEAFAQVAYKILLDTQAKKYDNDTNFTHLALATYIWNDIAKEKRFEVLMRLLVTHEDIRCQNVAWLYLDDYEHECCAGIPENTDMKNYGGVCFEAFTTHIAGRLKAPGPTTTAIVDYLLQSSPTATLKFLLSLSDTPPDQQKTWIEVNQFVETHYQESRNFSGGRTRQEFCTSTTVTGEEITRLASLYDGATWWQKIYLAEVIRQNPFLSSEKLVKNLKESKEPLVLLSLESRELEEAQGKVPRRSRWEIQAYGKK